MKTTTGRVLGGLLISGALVGTAVAATPESGTVSASAPKVTWTGQTTGGYLLRMPTAVSGSTETPCEAPACETFTLTVADSANLTIGTNVDSDSESAAVTVRITKPDGEVVQSDSDPGGPAAGKYHKVVIKKAPVGEYTINTYDNSADGMTHNSYAELAVAPAAAPEPAPVPAPAPSPGPPQQPGGEAVEPITLTVKPAKASARKRVVRAKVTVSRAVTSLEATLKKGSRTIATAKRGATSGTATLSLKAKRLKKGTYTLLVSATDGQTRTTKTVKVKVAR